MTIDYYANEPELKSIQSETIALAADWAAAQLPKINKHFGRMTNFMGDRMEDRIYVKY